MNTKYHNHMAMRHQFESRLTGWLFTVLALVGVMSAFGAFGESHAGIACAALPFLSLKPMLCDEFSGNAGGGSSVMEPKDFQAKVLDGISKVRADQKAMTDNLDKLDKESKKLADDFAKQVKSFEGTSGQVSAIELQLKKMELKIALERRAAFGSGLIRISQDVELRNTFNGIVRGELGKKNDRVRMNSDQKAAYDAHTKALAEGASPGSTYINDELHKEIYSTIAEYGLWGAFDVIPAGTKTTKLIVDSTDPVMGAVAENTDPGEGSYTGTSVSTTVKKLLGWLSVSNELLEDSEIDLTSHILMKYARATALRLDTFCLSADGTDDAANGAMTGIFAGGTAVVAAAGNVSTATLDYEDVLATLLGVDASVLSMPGACWFIHPQMLVRMLKIKDGNGRPIFLPAVDAPAPGALGSILGYPVKLAHAAPNTDAVSKAIAAFGDPMGNAVLLRKDFEFASSDQVKFTEDKTVFRARARAASKIKKATAFGVLTTAAA